MKRLMTVLLVLALALGSLALAEDHSEKLLGVWEADMGDEGIMTMNMGANGFGTYSQGGQLLGEFAFAVWENTMISAMVAEDGTVLFGAEEITFVDETTAIGVEDGVEMTFKRVEAPEVTEITLDNAFIGAWIADLPEVEGMVMEFKPNGTYAFKGGEYEGESGYLVIGDTMLSFGDEGECEEFIFAVIDENNMDVTEVSTGESARFVRVAAAEKAA